MKHLGILIALISLGLQAPLAMAQDITAPEGFVVSVKVNARGSNDFSAVHGRLVVQQVSDSALVEYGWSGSNCPNREITESQVEILFDLAATPYMLLVPVYLPGQLPNSRCLRGFTAFNEKYD